MLQLREVIQAFRECGVPNESQVERFGFVDAENDIQALIFDLVQAARHRFQFRTFVMPGWDPNILLGNIVHALNAVEPVVIGFAWRHFWSIRKTKRLRKIMGMPSLKWVAVVRLGS